uniref:NADH dehydrogenase subunit 6 n=1 Tax=Jamides bochus TaxID=544314 RepID=UPI00211E3293|nr:NADH dehydrogenase subunit 6 [Jamides bochus]UTT74589.1 NADH dehydrogenase subunit 6 [Jamides bochus]
MIKMFLSLSLIFISLSMIFINHPLSMGMMILIQTLLLCLMSGMLINTYWFSYILFLIFSGGLLVLFIYVSSIASNEMFKISMKIKMISFMYIILTMIFSFYLKNNLYFMNKMINEEMMMFFNSFFYDYNNINLSKLYNEQTYFLMMMMIIYLFITLIAVVKITNIFFGPLRSFN